MVCFVWVEFLVLCVVGVKGGCVGVVFCDEFYCVLLVLGVGGVEGVGM